MPIWLFRPAIPGPLHQRLRLLQRMLHGGLQSGGTARDTSRRQSQRFNLVSSRSFASLTSCGERLRSDNRQSLQARKPSRPANWVSRPTPIASSQTKPWPARSGCAPRSRCSRTWVRMCSGRHVSLLASGQQRPRRRFRPLCAVDCPSLSHRRCRICARQRGIR